MNFWSMLAASFPSVALIAVLGWLTRSIISQWLTRALDAHKSQLAAAAVLETERLKHQLQLVSLEQQSLAAKELEKSKHDLGMLRSTYEHHLDLILEYYESFYRHYRRCQRAANADGFKQPDGSVIDTKDEFLEALDAYIAEADRLEGKIRLILPANILAVHNELVGVFNQFRRAIMDFTPMEGVPRKKEEVFKVIHGLKQELENSLREFLRTENILK